MAYDVDAYVDFNNNHNQYMQGFLEGIQQGKKEGLQAIHDIMVKGCGKTDCDQCECKSVDPEVCEDRYVMRRIDGYIERGRE